MDTKLASTGRWALGMPKRKMWSRVDKHVEKKRNGETKGNEVVTAWETIHVGKSGTMGKWREWTKGGSHYLKNTRFLQYWERGETQWKGCAGKGFLTTEACVAWKEFKAGARLVKVCCCSLQCQHQCLCSYNGKQTQVYRQASSSVLQKLPSHFHNCFKADLYLCSISVSH